MDEPLAGRYQLGPVIGRGGMGVVHRARDLRLERDVAIKFLRADLATDAGVRRRFDGEARAAASLGHPNAVTVFDTGEHENDPYIVMELLPGRTLADDLAAGPLSGERVREIAMAVLGALAAAHDVGLVHRDVKPANILVADDGTAKVADFGIAKSAEGLDQTLTGQVVGTATYLSPERLGGEPATPSSDLYSLGVVLYEALAGRPPFTGDTPLAVAAAVRSTRPTPIGELRPDVDADLAGAIERAMERDPEDRFASASEMAWSLSPSAVPPVTEAGAAVLSSEPTRPLDVAATALHPAAAAPTTAPGAATGLPGGRAVGRARPDRSRLLAALAAAVVTVVAVVALVVWAGDGDRSTTDRPTATGATPVPSDGSLPPALDDALRRLEEAVQP